MGLGLGLQTFEAAMQQAEAQCRTLLQRVQHEWQDEEGQGKQMRVEARPSRALQTGESATLTHTHHATFPFCTTNLMSDFSGPSPFACLVYGATLTPSASIPVLVPVQPFGADD